MSAALIRSHTVSARLTHEEVLRRAARAADVKLAEPELTVQAVAERFGIAPTRVREALRARGVTTMRKAPQKRGRFAETLARLRGAR